MSRYPLVQGGGVSGLHAAAAPRLQETEEHVEDSEGATGPGPASHEALLPPGIYHQLQCCHDVVSVQDSAYSSHSSHSSDNPVSAFSVISSPATSSHRPPLSQHSSPVKQVTSVTLLIMSLDRLSG